VRDQVSHQVKKRQNYSSVYFNFYVIRKQSGRQRACLYTASYKPIIYHAVTTNCDEDCDVALLTANKGTENG
jgi:hypothetical protein